MAHGMSGANAMISPWKAIDETERHAGSGAKEQTRTADRTIFSRELYQLSYLGNGSRPALVGDRGLEPLTSTV